MRFKLPFALMLAIPVTACVDSNQPSDVDEVTAAIEQENGGFTTTDEAAAFGAEDLYASAAIESDTAVLDPMASDSSIIAMNASATVEAHNVLVMWGRMPADPTATTGRDWSGQLRLSRGGMIVRRDVAFEDATDRVLPRTTRDSVEFRSVTRPFADGLVLEIIDPTPADGPLSLTYTSADGTASYALDLSQLEAGPIVVDAGDGNRLVAAGHRRNDACSHGHMRGRWHALSPHAGVYLGVVANANGEVIGHVRGIYGERRNGDSVMFGKFIDRDGRFTGIINGSYHDGRFEARWIDRAGDHGVLKGAMFEGATLRAGGFVARWAETSCDR
jgi:hypothetical protein